MLFRRTRLNELYVQTKALQEDSTNCGHKTKPKIYYEGYMGYLYVLGRLPDS